MKAISGGAVRTFLSVSALGVLLLFTADPAAAGNRGIPINLGDSATTAITPAGDLDTFVFDAFAGTRLSVLVAGRKSGDLQPTLEILDPGGAAMDLTGFVKQKKQKISLKKLVLPVTGVYAIRIGGATGSEGEYQLRTKGVPVKTLSLHGVPLNPGETVDVTFAANVDTKVSLKVRAKGVQFEAISVHDPAGTEIAGARELFKFGRSGASATLFMVGVLGDYGVTLGNATAPATVDITAKFKHRRIAKRKLEISPLEPVVDRLEPEFGRPGAKVKVIGENFQEGDVVVLIGPNPANFLEVESDTLIEVQIPDGEGEVDVTVFNPDGQEGILEQGWTYIAPPPRITSITPTEGPDSGGTLVDVFGDSLTYVTEVELGGDLISTPPTILDAGHLRFRTDAHAPGLATLAIRDRWAQTGTLVGAFRFAAPPQLLSLDPLAGTYKGGTVLALEGGAFRDDDRVYLDGVEVTPVTFAGDTRLEVTVPAHARGLVDVFVRDPWNRDSESRQFEFNDGNFRDRTSTKMPKNTSSKHYGATAVALGDLDGDKSPDLVLGNVKPAAPNVPTRILLNDKKGGFKSEGGGLPDTFDARDLALGDLDGDGDLDLVITMDGIYTKGSYYYVNYPIYYWTYNTPFNSTRILLNNGKGTFTLARSLLPNPRQKKGSDLLQGVALALGDLDGDSDLDLVVTHNKNVASTDWSGYLYYWGYSGSYYKYFYTKYDTTMQSTRILLNNGKGAFTNVTKTRMPAVSKGDMFAGDDVLLGDVDGDKDLDIILTGDGSNLRDSKKVEYVKGSKTRILKNTGGTFTNDTSTLFPATKTGDDWGGTALALGDLDGDSTKDLVVSLARGVSYTDAGGTKKYLSSTRVFSGSKTGKFTESTSSVLPSVRSDGQGEMWRAVEVVIADPDADGDSDLFLVDRSSVKVFDAATNKFDKQVPSTRFLLNTGTTPLTDVTPKSMPSPAKTGDYYLADAIVIGDVDGDNKLDMVLSTMLASYLTDGKFPTRLLLFE